MRICREMARAYNSLPAKEAFGFENLHGHNDFGLAEACVAFLRRNSEQPFFLVASFDNPHNICEYARHQNPPYASFEEPALEDCPGLPANLRSIRMMPTPWLSSAGRTIGFIRP